MIRNNQVPWRKNYNPWQDSEYDDEVDQFEDIQNMNNMLGKKVHDNQEDEGAALLQNDEEKSDDKGD